MKFRLFIPIFLLTQQPHLHGQTETHFLKKGTTALDDGLWEIAETHFKNALADTTLSADAKAEIIIRLAESLIRDGNPTEALPLLDQSLVAKNPELPFWKAMALVSQTRFTEAIGIFTNILANPKSPHRIEAGFTQASLQLSLGQTNEALDTLAALLADADEATLVRIRLYQVQVFLDLQRTEDARQAMPERSVIAETDRPQADFLEAQLLLKEGRADIAEARFRNFLSKSTGRVLSRHHASAVGLADALRTQGNLDDAAKSLLDFIQDHPDSPLLDAMFKRIIDWLPEKLTITDPILERVTQWITPYSQAPTAGIPGATGSTAVSAWPVNTQLEKTSAPLAYSIYTRAIGLERIATPEAQRESMRLFTRLRVEYPEHHLIPQALYHLAKRHLREAKPDLAFSILDTLQESTNTPSIKGKAAFLEAREAYQKGDLEVAIRLFDQASRFLTGDDTRSARRNLAITKIRTAQENGTTLIQLEGNPPDKELEADLLLEKALSTTPRQTARVALEDFINRFPQHPRNAEARIAAAEAALSEPSPDISFATVQLDALAAAPEASVKIFSTRIALAHLRVADLKRDSPATIAAAQTIIDTWPNLPEAAEAEFTLGRNLFQSGNYNSARLTLEKLAARDTDFPRAQAAWLLAARSAALGGTEASKKEALILFDKAIEVGSSTTAIASLEKARHLIDMARAEEAAAFLRGWIATFPKDDSLQLPAGLLLGEALSAQGSSHPPALAAALTVYDNLLLHAGSQSALIPRLQYLRGRTLELMPDEKNPAKKRERQAFQAYYSVLETDSPPAEWEYFELSAFRALALLEKAGRWQTAINVAKKIASFKGPRAEEAAARADKIQLKEMMFESE